MSKFNCLTVLGLQNWYEKFFQGNFSSKISHARDIKSKQVKREEEVIGVHRGYPGEWKCFNF